MGKKGTRSKTRPGRKNYTTKRGDKVYHIKGQYITKTHKPYSYRKGSASKRKFGLLDYTTKLGNLMFHQDGHNLRRSRRPYSK